MKLTDFGLAKKSSQAGLKTFCGTPQYFAPEVLSRRTTVTGKGRYDDKSDMWSLGVILYVVLCGAPPFDADGTERTVRFEGARWSEVSPSAKSLVGRLLHLDPAKRLGIEAACNDKWIGVEDGDTHVWPYDDPMLKGVDYGGSGKKSKGRSKRGGGGKTTAAAALTVSASAPPPPANNANAATAAKKASGKASTATVTTAPAPPTTTAAKASAAMAMAAAQQARGGGGGQGQDDPAQEEEGQGGQRAGLLVVGEEGEGGAGCHERARVAGRRERDAKNI